MHRPVIETGALPWKGSMLPLHQRRKCIFINNFIGPFRESNPGPLAPKASIIPLDQAATILLNYYV